MTGEHTVGDARGVESSRRRPARRSGRDRPARLVGGAAAALSGLRRPSGLVASCQVRRLWFDVQRARGGRPRDPAPGGVWTFGEPQGWELARQAAPQPPKVQ